MALISTRLPEDMERALKWYAKKERLGTTIALRKILDKGIKEIKIEYALELYRNGRIGIGRVAKLVEISIWEAIDIIREKRIPMHYTQDDVEKDLEIAMKISKKLK